MLTYQRTEELKRSVLQWKQAGCSIGFVPTMGALHEGHISLVKEAQKQCDKVVVSIFVNPLQFNNPDDLAKYPRDTAGDTALLEKENIDVLFLPEYADVYPDKTTKHYALGEIEKVLEGTSRPGHFQGVAEVVNRFFTIVEPDKAFFGKKDFQQMAVIRKMAGLTGFAGEIIGVSTCRETSGLAMSSRNRRLSEMARTKAAPKIFEILQKLSTSNGGAHAQKLCSEGKAFLTQHDIGVEYLLFAEEKDLRILSEGEFPVPGRDRLFIAVEIEGVRLIDNLGVKL
ncbi:MAG: pantoate--beta-alanine ligase [Sphingobacteriales bacterium]